MKQDHWTEEFVIKENNDAKESEGYHNKIVSLVIIRQSTETKVK